jgi:hypothetical protein
MPVGFLGVERHRREANHSLPSGEEIKDMCSYTPMTARLGDYLSMTLPFYFCSHRSVYQSVYYLAMEVDKYPILNPRRATKRN